MTITMWRLCVSLLFLELQTVEGTIGVQITPCTDSFVEVPADGSLTLNCTPQTQSMEWRLSLGGSSYLSAKFENGQYVQENLPFNVSSDPGKISLTVNTSNIRNITLVNGTVVCQDLTQSPPSSSNCGLNYVYRPKSSDISCTARADMDADRLSCTIINIYSSRGIYTCQALRRNDETQSELERLNTVNMASLNDEGGLKVSGECNIRTELPENAGNYSYSVKILPGGLEVLANLLGGEKWIEHYRPKESDISCTAWDECKTNVKLYCTINIYSSRGVYTCQAFREKLGQNSQEELNTVNMTTTNDEGGRTMTGKCIITTELPEKAGNYSYSVKISPGGSKKEAKLPDGGKWIEHVGTGTAVPSQAAIYNVLTVWLVAAFVLL